VQAVAQEVARARVEGPGKRGRDIQEAILHRPQPAEAIGGDDATPAHVGGQIWAAAMQEVSPEEQRVARRHQRQSERVRVLHHTRARPEMAARPDSRGPCFRREGREREQHRHHQRPGHLPGIGPGIVVPMGALRRRSRTKLAELGRGERDLRAARAEQALGEGQRQRLDQRRFEARGLPQQAMHHHCAVAVELVVQLRAGGPSPGARDMRVQLPIDLRDEIVGQESFHDRAAVGFERRGQVFHVHAANTLKLHGTPPPSVAAPMEAHPIENRQVEGRSAART
jgi:hypothetical protein